MQEKYNSGIIHLIPLLVVAILVLGVSFSSFGKKVSNENHQDASVLSKSSSGEGEKTEVKSEEENQKTESDSSTDNPEKVGDLDKNSEEDKNDDSGDDADIDETENEDELEIEDEDITEVEDEVESATEGGITKTKIKIRSGNNKFEFESEGLTTQSLFPLSVNPETHELTITTPSGTKVVAILPDQAITNLKDNKKISVVDSTEVAEGENSEIEYKIEGDKNEKLLGIIDVKVHKKFKVSSQTGEVTSVEQSFFSKLLDLLSV